MTSRQIDEVLARISQESMQRALQGRLGELSPRQKEIMDALVDSIQATQFMTIASIMGNSSMIRAIISATFLEVGYEIAQLERAEKEQVELDRMMGLDKRA